MDAFEHRQQHEREGGPGKRVPLQAPPELGPFERLASAVGNQAFGAFVRTGAGIMPDGRAHPDVETTIARTRGGGNSLQPGVRERFGADLGDSLEDVRVHTDDTAHELTQAVSARAFATGNDLYFARGEYRPGSSEGDRLLAHELTHVAQQQGAPTEGPLVVSEPGDPLEREADEAAGELSG
jgi:hypothetical protein